MGARYEDLYLVFNAGGINYGPRYRSCRNAYKISHPSDPNPLNPKCAGPIR